MTSKLRRPPLFWNSDNSRGMAVAPVPSFSKCTTSSSTVIKQSSSSKYSKKMECGVTATSRLNANGSANGIMTDVRTERSPAKTGLHVNFTEKTDVKEKREKFLTAKYGSHQMGLIRKRLAVEMWLYDELQKLYESPVGSTVKSQDGEVEVDIDELLDMDSDDQRRKHLKVILADAKKSPLDVQKFVEALLERTKTL